MVPAQTKSIKDLYWGYLQVRSAPKNKANVINKALELLDRSSELNAKQIANLTYHLGRLYEETGEVDKAVSYYEKSIKLTPGYYVPYRALGFINIKNCNIYSQKMNEAAKAKNAVLHAKAFAAYKTQALKTIGYLEKSQACDPDDETLAMIKNLYKNIKDNSAIHTLNARLKVKSADCITLLDDE